VREISETATRSRKPTSADFQFGIRTLRIFLRFLKKERNQLKKLAARNELKSVHKLETGYYMVGWL
jgi:hypothetical protein